MNNKIIKKITATLAILLLFILVISCPVTNNTKEDPSAVIEPQAPVYLLLLEQNDATETATKALYYDRALYKWGKSYSPSRGIYNELSVSDKISVPKKVVQVSFDIPYSGDSTTFDNKATYEAPFAGYYLYSKDGVSEEREFINEEGLLVDNIRDEGIKSRTVVKAKFNKANIDLQTISGKVNEFIRSLGKEEQVAYWTDSDGNTYGDTGSGWVYTTDKKNSVLTLKTTSTSARLEFDLRESTNIDEATKAVYYNEGKWYKDLSFKEQTSSVVPPKKEHKVTFEINPDNVKSLSGEKNPSSMISKYDFNGYKDGNSLVIDKDGKISEEYTLGEKEIKTLTPSFSESGSGIDLSKLPYEKNITVRKGYLFKGWSKTVSGEILSEDIYYPTQKESVLYGVWEPIVYELDLNSDPGEGISLLKYAKIYYWQDHGWYKTKDALHEDSEKIDKIDIPEKRWMVLIDDSQQGKVIESVIKASPSQYSGLNEDRVNKLYYFEFKWVFDGYSVNGQTFIDKDGNILTESYVRLSSDQKADWKWNDIEEKNKPLLPIASLMNENAGKLQISKTFKQWKVTTDEESILLDDNKRLDPKPEYIYTGSDKIIPDKPEIRITSAWEIENGGILTLLPGSSTEFEDIDIYSISNTTGGSGGWYSDSEGIDRITSIPQIPKKQWTVSFDPANGNEIINRNYSFNFDGFFVGGARYINDKGEIIATPFKGSLEALPQFTPQSATGVEFPSANLVQKDGYDLIGWSKNSESTEPEYPISEGYFTPESNNVVLYAVWKARVNTITFASSATSSDWTRTIYSRLENNVLKYYMDAECTVPYSSDKFIKPKREYSISFENTKGVNVTSIPVTYSFGGYKTIPLGSEEPQVFMNENAEIVYSGNISRSIDCEAVLTHDASQINLPTNIDPESLVTGYKFSYWSISPGGEEFVPSSYTSNLKLYAVWQSIVYTLNLDFTGATDTENATSVLYYAYDKGWYSQIDAEGKVIESSAISTSNPIKFPKKTISVNYNKNTTEEITVTPSNLFDDTYRDQREFKYKSYNDIDGKTYIKTDGSIVDKIYKNTNAYIEWQNVDPIDVNKYIVAFVNENSNLKFVGWSDDSESENIYVNQYAPSSSVGPEVTLYAKWQRNDLYKLTLSDSGATESGQLNIYYQPPQAGTGSGMWFSDSEGEIPLVDNTLSVLPKKEFRVILVDTDENESDTEEVITSAYTFGGYVLSTTTAGDVQISSEGKLKDGSYLNSDAVSEARWSEKPQTIKLPSKSKTGYIFKGWSLKRGGEVLGTDDFIPDTDGVKLYAVWESRVYSLDLFNAIDFDDEGAIKYKTLYYKYNVGWFNDKLCTDSISGSITLPKSIFVVTFDIDKAKHPNVANPETKEVHRLFNGYYLKGEGSYYYNPIIDKNGVIVEKISEDTKAYSQWDYSLVSVSLPSGYNDPGWTFKGWTTGNNQLYTTSFNPTGDTGLTAVWQPNTYTLRLNHNSATDISDVPDVINYVTGDGWYNLDGSKITSIKIPKKEYTVHYSTIISDPINDDPSISAFKFSGYYLNGEIAYIDKDGLLIDPNKFKLTGNVTVSAKWEQGKDQIINPPTSLTNQRLGYEFKGWSEVENSTNIIPAGPYTPRSKETTLYAVFAPYVTKLNFVLQDKDNSFITNPEKYTKVAYYRYDDAWYEDVTCNIPLSEVVIPARSIVVTLTTKHPVSAMQTEYQSNFPFVKFANLNGDDVYTDINELTGKVTIKPSKKITKETTVYAFYGTQQNIKLPDTDVMKYPGWQFDGWKSGDEILPAGNTYKPNDNITFDAIWIPVKSKLTLTSEDGRNPNYQYYIYYKAGGDKCWFSDPNCQTPIDKIPLDNLPERYYEASFDVNSTDVNPPSYESIRYTYPFDGFMLGNERIIGKDGSIYSTASISSDSVAYAVWTQSDPIKLERPQKEGSTFIGWNETGRVDDGNILLDSIVLTKDIALKAIWGQKTFVLTLKADDATSTSHTNEVYYITEGSEKGWYLDLSEGKQPTETIIIPEKKYTVTFDYDMGSETSNETEEYSYTFEGYYEGEKPWVGSNGAFADGSGITRSTEAHVKWSSNNPMLINANHRKNRDGYKFKGWSEKKGDTETLGDLYTPKSNITLYAVWESDIYTVNLSAPDADNRDEIIQNLYYKVGVGWYKTIEDAKNEINKVVSISDTLPKKTYNITLKPGKEQPEIAETSYFNFEGFVLNGETYIGPAGIIVKESITSADNNATISVKWSASPSSISLPSYTYGGYEFAGWSTIENDDPATAIKTAHYVPTKNNEVLYGIWSANIYTLTLVAEDTTSGPYDYTRNLYYKVDSGWYFDKEATERKVSETGRIIIPKKEWTVRYITSIVTAPEDTKSVFTFAGYIDDNSKEAITSEGRISSEYAKGITQNTVARVSWKDQTSVALPSISSTGWTFYGWTEQEGGNKDNVLKTTEYTPRKSLTLLYGIWNANIFVLNLSADDGRGVVESPYTAIYYKLGDTESGGGWYLTPNASGNPITALPSIPRSYYTVSYDDIYIAGIYEQPSKYTQQVDRPFRGFSVNGEMYIDANGNILKRDGISSSYNANAEWNAANPVALINSDELLKAPYYIFKQWTEKETGVVITSPYTPDRDITIVPEYKNRFIEFIFDDPTNANYSNYNFPVNYTYDRLWLDIKDGKWNEPYGEGQKHTYRGEAIERNIANYKNTTYSLRIADPVSSGWTTPISTEDRQTSWKNLGNEEKELTAFYEGYDTDVKNVQIELPSTVKGIGFVDTTGSLNNVPMIRLVTNSNFELLDFNTIKSNNPNFDFESYDPSKTKWASYHVGVLYSIDEELGTKLIPYPTSDDADIIRRFEYDNRPECFVINTHIPTSVAEREKYELDYNAYCNEFSDEDEYYTTKMGYRIVEILVTHAKDPISEENEIVAINRDGDWNISMEGGGIQFKNSDNNARLTHYLLPVPYLYGEYLPADITLSDYKQTEYKVQRVKSYAEHQEVLPKGYQLQKPDGTKVDITAAEIIPYTDL